MYKRYSVSLYMFLKYTPITDSLNQFYVLCIKQRNTKISLITTKRVSCYLSL